jgi:sarcosine oxidase subunit gamma
MADSYSRQSPLAHLHLIARASEPATGSGVQVSENQFTRQFVLRGDAGDETFLAVVKEKLGASLPITPNTVSGGDDAGMLWLGPDEWLVVSDESFDIGSKLSSVVAGHHAAASDVSESRTILKISGVRARDVMARGCALDLHPRSFGTGQCAQTMLAQAHIILHQTSDAPEYEIYVHRSFAEYLWSWLEDASAEYGLTVGA